MKKPSFEEQLENMKKPEVSELKHQEFLSATITKAKDNSALSWWWLIIPLYLIAAFIIKSFYMPQSNLISDIHELKKEHYFTTTLCFLILPLVFAILNMISIRKTFFLSGNPAIIPFIKVVWFNVLIIALSVIILIVFIL